MDSRNNVQNVSLPRIRVLSLGNCSVGKSCLIKRYCEQRFVQRYMPTIGIDYGSTTVDVNGRKVSVHFFDTSGNPLFEEVRTEFYPDMQGVMLVYDVTDKSSFASLDHWMAELRHNLGQPGVNSLVIVVVGTRSDTGGSPHGRQVSEVEGQEWADRHGAKHVVTSAALGTGVTQAFMTLFSAALQHKVGGDPSFSAGQNGSTTASSNSKPAPSTTTGTAKGTAGTAKGTAGTSRSTPYSSGPNSASSSAYNPAKGAAAGPGTGSKSSSTATAAGPSTTNKPPPSTAKQTTPGGTTKATPTGGQKPPGGTTSNAPPTTDPEALAAVNRLLHHTDHFQRLALSPRNVSKDDVNRAYRKLAGLVHPDKCKATGAEDAFKRLGQSRSAILSMITETTV